MWPCGRLPLVNMLHPFAPLGGDLLAGPELTLPFGHAAPPFAPLGGKKGTPEGVVYRAQGPALGSWEDRL